MRRWGTLLIIMLGSLRAQAQSLDFLEVPERPIAARGPVDPAARRSLDELAAEQTRWQSQAQAYRRDLVTLTTRRLHAMRRELELRYAAPLRAERRLHARAT